MAKKILLVEDEEDLRSILEEVLLLCGYEVATAENGRAALDYLGKNPPPGIILLDLTMPIMSGREFLVEMNSGRYPQLEGIPVAIVSAVAEHWEPPANFHCVARIRKPAEIRSILQVTKRFM